MLVVEDNPADAFAIKRALADSPLSGARGSHGRSRAGLARTAAAGRDRARRRAARRRSPGAILIELKQGEKTHAIPVIVTSSTGDTRKAIHLGADEYLEKPVEAERLIAVLRRWTGDGSSTGCWSSMTRRSAGIWSAGCCRAARSRSSRRRAGPKGWRGCATAARTSILLDLNLPEMDGFAFLDRLASAGGSRLPPVVVLTSMALDRHNRARLPGVSRVLSKSELSPRTLIEAIRMATQQTAEDNPRWH